MRMCESSECLIFFSTSWAALQLLRSFLQPLFFFFAVSNVCLCARACAFVCVGRGVGCDLCLWFLVFWRARGRSSCSFQGTVKRNVDSHFIHANVDTDVLVTEEPPMGSTRKPHELYTVIEHFCNGRRRLELFGETHNIRPGWCVRVWACAHAWSCTL